MKEGAGEEEKFTTAAAPLFPVALNHVTGLHPVCSPLSQLPEGDQQAAPAFMGSRC